MFHQAFIYFLQSEHAQALPYIEGLVDPGSVFLAIGMNRSQEEKQFRLYTAVVRIAQTDVMFIAFNERLQAGMMTAELVRQALRALQLARQWRLPVVMVLASAGADLYRQADLFVKTGELYYQLACLQAESIPTLCWVHGVATAGGAYLPAMCQVVIASHGAQIYLANPLLVKAATGQVADAESLGGANMHVEKTGLVDYWVADAKEAHELIVQQVKSWGRQCGMSRCLLGQSFDWQQEEAGLVDTECLITALADTQPTWYRQAFASDVLSATIECGGLTLGVLAATAPLTHRGATKAADFITDLSASATPVLFIQNTVGFMVGQAEESNGVIVAGARLLQAISVTQSPKLVLHVGPSYGAGYYAFCGRPFQADVIFGWPNYRLAVMGGKNAAEVLVALKVKKGLSAEDAKAMKARIMAQYEQESSANYASARGFDDGLIAPEDSKSVLIRVLELLESQR